MVILNEDNTGVKTLLKNTTCVYITKNTEEIEQIGDIIELANLNYNTVLQSLCLSSTSGVTGMVADLVLLDANNKEIKILKSTIAFGTVLNNKEQLTTEQRVATLEELIVAEGEVYKNQFVLALKITTAPTTAIEGVKILSEINFIEKV